MKMLGLKRSSGEASMVFNCSYWIMKGKLPTFTLIEIFLDNWSRSWDHKDRDWYYQECRHI
jgi:hypothetical protein